MNKKIRQIEHYRNRIIDNNQDYFGTHDVLSVLFLGCTILFIGVAFPKSVNPVASYEDTHHELSQH